MVSRPSLPNRGYGQSKPTKLRVFWEWSGCRSGSRIASCLTDDRLLALYEAEDHYYGRMLGVAYAEIFHNAVPLLVEDPTMFRPAIHG